MLRKYWNNSIKFKNGGYQTRILFNNIDFEAFAYSLKQRGYAIIDNVIDDNQSEHLRNQIDKLYLNQTLYSNHTHVMKGNTTKFIKKKHIYETELAVDIVRQQVPDLGNFFFDDTLVEQINRLFPHIEANAKMTKVQFNEGNEGCFPMHYDTYGSDGKCVTAILYLNEAWVPSDGGQLRLYPFPYSEVDVEPINCRLVAFSSRQMLHRVLPAFKPRYCLTTWLYSPSYQLSPPRLISNMTTVDAYLLSILQKFTRSEFRMHLSKLYYAEEWKTSLIQSHENRQDLDDYLEEFERELCIIKASAESYLAKVDIKNRLNHTRTDSIIKYILTEKDRLPNGLVTWI